MQTIYMVIVDCGDGSNSIEWHKTWSDEKHEKLENKERYQSGDELQIRELRMPDMVDLDAWAKINYITWADDTSMEDDEDEPYL